MKSARNRKRLAGRVFVGLDLVYYSGESEGEADGANDKCDWGYFVYFFVNQINANIAWDASEKPEKASDLFEPRKGLGSIKSVISDCCKN